MVRWYARLLLQSGPAYGWQRVCALLGLSIVLVSGIPWGVSKAYFFLVHKRACSTVRILIQAREKTGPDSVSLSSTYFAEALGLSLDEPRSLQAFNTVEGERMLRESALFTAVHLKKVKPDRVYVHYATRIPFAYIGDCTNTAIDREGYLFPYAPFYLPRYMPSIYLGEEGKGLTWGGKVSAEMLDLVSDICTLLGQDRIESIDLTHASSHVSGCREIVLSLKNGTLLRVAPKNYKRQIANYDLLVRTYLQGKVPRIIDLRLAELAYITW